MSFNSTYTHNPPSIEALSSSKGFTLLEFGTDWCGHCQAATPAVKELVMDIGTSLEHLRVLDGKGKALGRHFQVKLWPTLILLDKGVEIARVVRPTSSQDLQPILDAIKQHQ